MCSTVGLFLPRFLRAFADWKADFRDSNGHRNDVLPYLFNRNSATEQRTHVQFLFRNIFDFWRGFVHGCWFGMDFWECAALELDVDESFGDIWFTGVF